MFLPWKAKTLSCSLHINTKMRSRNSIFKLLTDVSPIISQMSSYNKDISFLQIIKVKFCLALFTNALWNYPRTNKWNIPTFLVKEIEATLHCETFKRHIYINFDIKKHTSNVNIIKQDRKYQTEKMLSSKMVTVRTKLWKRTSVCQTYFFLHDS